MIQHEMDAIHGMVKMNTYTSSDKIPRIEKDNDIINTFGNRHYNGKFFKKPGVTPAVVMVLFESLPMERTIGRTETASTFTRELYLFKLP